MKKKSDKIIIEGMTQEGKKFRPSDWAERMSDNLATFHNRRIVYSPLLQPMVKGGTKCVMLDAALKESNPELYHSILEFAENNNLIICADQDKSSSDKEK